VLDGSAARSAREAAEVRLREGERPPAKNGRGKKNGVPPTPIQPQLATQITVRGARQHNLKSVDAVVERDKMTVFCGPSGSGKSSLAMDTIYAEGQRRYVESLSAYARQFVAQMQKPAVEHIDGLSPAIAIEQKNLGHTPRSTVGTVTEIYDYLRILMARLGEPHCPECEIPIGTQTADQVTDAILTEPAGTRMYLMAPVEVEVGHQYDALWAELRGKGYQRVRIDGVTTTLESVPELDRRRKHRVEVVLDRITVKEEARSRIAGSIEQALAFGKGVLHVCKVQDEIPEPRWETKVHSQHLACRKCGRSFEPLTPHSFSFNSPLGWCGSCEGLGVQTGANLAALLGDPKLTLAEGVLSLWPNLSLPVAKAMLDALSRGTGLPLDVPFELLPHRYRRVVLHGSGEQWLEVAAPAPAKEAKGDKAKPRPPLFRFQFKGLYPALEEASRLSPTLRVRLEQMVAEVECSTCGGSRLRDDASAVRFRGRTVGDLCRLPLKLLADQIHSWNLSDREQKIAGELAREITSRLQFLLDIGLDYLSLSRPAATLSNGEAQRIRLASQLGSGLCGVLYVLDEPTIGLHPRDNRKLLKALHRLRDLGNTLLVVEHDKEVIESCDQVLDFGPRAGRLGGEIVAFGTPDKLGREKGSVTGPYLTGKKAIPVPKTRRIQPDDFAQFLARAAHKPVSPTYQPDALDPVYEMLRELTGARPDQITQEQYDTAREVLGLPPQRREANAATAATKKTKNAAPPPAAPPGPPPREFLSIINARHNNLRNIDAHIPLAALTAITGPSGSGKSTLMEEVLYASLARRLHRAAVTPGAHDEIRGIEQINKVIRVDQQPLGNSPTSNPATYTGCFELIRQLFSQLPDAKVRGYTARRFSFNVPGGRCETCEGNGQQKIEMHFLPDVWVQCEVCRGKRYNPETLAVQFHGRSISDVLDLTCGDALALFANIPKIRRILQTLCDVGLDYLTLGQPAPTLSGGEAQRVKLAAELARPDTGRTLYLLDEPTTGLHFDDLAKLLEVLQRLVDIGNTVVVIEHNLDIIKCCDWLVDLGPEAGEGGGRVVAFGTPEQVLAQHHAALASLPSSPTPAAKPSSPKKAPKSKPAALSPFTPHPTPHSNLPSHTATFLEPVLTAGPFADRKPFDPHKLDEVRPGDLDITEVGQDSRMPWQVDGRLWHTKDRVGRTGEACKWDGRILERVVDRIHELGEFSETNWSERTVVEICAEKKADGWFFHAITGETWLLKLKFRVYRGTFKRDDLQDRIQLKTLNELDELPIYGNEPRVKVKTLKGPWQEVEIRVHSLEEIDTPEFWSFVEDAVQGFFKFTEKAADSPEDISPWKVLGQKWHLLRKGFAPGRQVAWPAETLEELLELIRSVAPQAEFLWGNQQLVHVMTPQQRDPWATIYTKRPQSVLLILQGPKGKFAFGRFAALGSEPELDDLRKDRDLVKIHFLAPEQVHEKALRTFLQEHLASLGGSGSLLKG
jgi:excinuclease ABC subunit A